MEARVIQEGVKSWVQLVSTSTNGLLTPEGAPGRMKGGTRQDSIQSVGKGIELMKKTHLNATSLRALAGVLLVMVMLGGCGGEDILQDTTTTNTTGTVKTTLSDPPTCKGPLAPSDLKFQEVWVTVTRVRAHTSGTAEPNASGWVDLVDLRNDPMQLDLLDTSVTGCVLATLGATTGLPLGDYQQIRFHLLSNNPGPTEVTPSPNACEGTSGFNCVKPVSGPMRILLLNSQDLNGIKIPPGRIVGGAISLEAGQAADINIAFNACDSIIRQGNGEFRLKPTLTAGEVSVTTDTISGRVVSTIDGNPLPGIPAIVVLFEQEDAEGINRVIVQTLANATDGTFSVCPLTEGNYDVVIAAIDGNGVTYNATITFGMPTGTNMGDIGLEPESGTDTSPGVIQGQVTSEGTSGAAEIDVSVSALQEATRAGATSPTLVTIPLLGDSTPSISTVDDPANCPTGKACADYMLNVPASNPRVGNFDPAGTTYTAPAMGDVLYSVNSMARNGGEPNCTNPSITVDKDNAGNPLKVVAGVANAVTAETIAFIGCTGVTTE